MEESYKYTVIIPHKNIPNLLQRCLDSIPQRDDLEVIIIDDNSNAERVNFDEFPGLNRANTKVIFDKSGKGAGHARNIGIEVALGKMILFADSDDFFNNGFNDFLTDYSNDNSSDLLFFNANSVYTDSYKPAHRADHLHTFIDEYKSGKKNGEKKLRFIFGEPWGKVVKKTLLDKYDIRFEETPIHNDTAFSYKVGYYAETIAVDNRELYCITVRSGSTSVSENREKLLIRIGVFGRAEKFLKSKGVKLYSLLHYRQIVSNLRHSYSLYKESKNVLLNEGFSNFDIYKGIFKYGLRVITNFFRKTPY
ncbi:MAG: glycosyltransferase family 2 protein [Bacteroidales bacterium]|nr:glycosyltransferase family 2 protein [Bacteroidales bacterium]